MIDLHHCSLEAERAYKCDVRRRTNAVFAEQFTLKKNQAHTPKSNNKKNMICSTEQSRRGALFTMPSLFTFRATQPPEIGTMAKITLLHSVAYEKATPSSGLTSLGMKIRNRHVKSRVYKNVLELQSSWNTSRVHLPNWNQIWHVFYACVCIIRPFMSSESDLYKIRDPQINEIYST
ncbi:hypothetical protein AVEN_88174-1 [Araneus ventricosus]|uniref:Uncharacterized protein n=1 Tax=Araneus ventricosus TaxID=182803 RepID=A0A4Y2RY68_ARAVE|nr:hypothetical protein AVEN_88174-1 [Araneus ventricosus]